MRVVIALVSSAPQLSGVQRHAINVARCLLLRHEITAVQLVAAPWQREFVEASIPRSDARLHLSTAEIGSGVLERNLWYYAKLPRLAADFKASIIHLACPAPLRRKALSCPAVVALHDLYPFDIPENFGFPKVLFNRLVLRQCVRAADAIACVSNSTLAQLGEIEPALARDKSIVIANCVEPYHDVSIRIPLAGWSGQPFLLCVAQHRRNKNILFLLKVFERLLRTSQVSPEMHLVIVGIEGPETKAILRFLDHAKIAERVVLLSGISEEELQWCYRNCELLLAPSTVEGFGLPVAEALVAGCRVICSDIPAFHEVGGDHCCYVSLDSHAEQNFIAAVLAYLHEPPPAAVSLPQLSAQVIAEGYLRLYRSLLRSTEGRGAESSVSACERQSTV